MENQKVIVRTYRVVQVFFWILILLSFSSVAWNFLAISKTILDPDFWKICGFIGLLFFIPASYIFRAFSYDDSEIRYSNLGVVNTKILKYSDIESMDYFSSTIFFKSKRFFNSVRMIGAFENYNKHIRDLLTRILLVNPTLKIPDEIKQRFKIP